MGVHPLVRARWAAATAWHARREVSLPFYSLERLSSIQSRRVRAMVRHAYASVPFYRQVMDERGIRPDDLRSATDLERLPLVTGRDLAAWPDRFRSTRYRDRPTLELITTGTTGALKRVHYDHAALFAVFAAGQRQRQVLRSTLGRALGYREVAIVPPGGTGVTLGAFWASHGWIPGPVAIRRCEISTTEPFARAVERLNRFRPDVVLGFGSAIGALYRRAWLEGVHLFRPRAIVYGGDLLRPPDLRLLERHHEVPVFATYQAVEALRIAFQCELRGGHHLSLDQVAVRVIDEAGTTVAPGTAGRVVVSNLVNRATVLLNYVLGDRVTLSPRPCPCGRGLPTLDSIDGRADDLLLSGDGELLHESVILPRLYEVPGVAVLQVIQESRTSFRLKVIPAVGADWDATAAGLRRALASLVDVGGGATIEVDRVEALGCDGGGKLKTIVRRIAVPSAAVDRDPGGWSG